MINDTSQPSSDKARKERKVTLLGGQSASKAAVDEIFCRVRAAAGEWPGRYAIESLADIVLRMDDSDSITDPLQARVLYEHQLITTPEVPIRRNQITGGVDGLTASVVSSSVRWERGDTRIVRPYQDGPQ